eukprot:SAG31_NODE_1114_length_9852_cov_2.761509_3_plen_130_part_00
MSSPARKRARMSSSASEGSGASAKGGGADGGGSLQDKVLKAIRATSGQTSAQLVKICGVSAAAIAPVLNLLADKVRTCHHSLLIVCANPSSSWLVPGRFCLPLCRSCSAALRIDSDLFTAESHPVCQER